MSLVLRITRPMLVGFLGAAATIALLAVPALAELSPGEVVTHESAAKVRDLVSPGVYYKVTNGMSMTVMPTERIEWPPPYKIATEKYSAKVRLSQDGRKVLNNVSRQTFQFIDVRVQHAA